MRTLIIALLLATNALAQTTNTKPRARDLGVPFDGAPGPLNAITDVAGVLVGQTTLISGEGPLKVGAGPVRTGVTAVLPRGRELGAGVAAGFFSLNGNGEMTGTHWVEESGVLEGPILITNTHSVGVVHDAVIQYMVQHAQPGSMPWALPVVAETYDGFLNDINGFHVKPEHVFHALDVAAAGAMLEGGVGGGTGMVCNGFKGGIGTASRKLPAERGGYTVGVLVQCNYGSRNSLRIAGVPVGREIKGYQRKIGSTSGAAWPKWDGSAVAANAAKPPASAEDITVEGQPASGFQNDDVGSIIIVVATDAPLVGQQCKRLARRAALGIGRNGGTSGNGSGDLFIAFSTANAGASLNSFSARAPVQITVLPNGQMDPLFEATVQATEEAIVNAMVAGETMTGINGNTIYGLPHDELRTVLRKYNRLEEK